jgi:hypothetical protein
VIASAWNVDRVMNVLYGMSMVNETTDTNGYWPTGYNELEKLRGAGKSLGNVCCRRRRPEDGVCWI